MSTKHDGQYDQKASDPGAKRILSARDGAATEVHTNDMDKTVDIKGTLGGKTDRRKMLGASALAAATAAMWRPQSASGVGQERGRSLVFDVACLGTSFAPNVSGGLDLPSGDLRGVSFIVEGLIFPAWTIPDGVEFDLDLAPPATGAWFCRGWFTSHPGRPLPYTMNVQEYVLDPITDDNLSPPDTLTSSGPEGAVEEQDFVRAVIGGTGKHRGAQGEVAMETIGTNSSILNLFGGTSPNFRFHFDFANGRN